MNWKLIRIIDAYVGIPLVFLLSCMQRAAKGDSGIRERAIPRRILMVKFWGIGNIFMMMPAAATLRRAHPDAKLELLTLETSRGAAVSVGMFDNVHTVDAGGLLRFIRSTLSVIAELRLGRYDAIIDFEQFARFSALLIVFMRSKMTVGFNTAGQHRHFLFTRPVSYDNAVHITRSYTLLAEAAGAAAGQFDDSGFFSEPGASPRERREPPGRPITGGPYVVLHVGTSDNFKERRWPASCYAALADRLIENHGLTAVLTGLADEASIAADVAGNMRFRGRVVDESGKLGFRDYFDLIRSAVLVISADTAAVHIASATGVPVVGLYGPNTPLLYGPWGGNGIAVYHQLPCSPCITNFNAKTHDCRHPDGKGACMRRISAEEVYARIAASFAGLLPSVQPAGREGVGPCSR